MKRLFGLSAFAAAVMLVAGCGGGGHGSPFSTGNSAAGAAGTTTAQVKILWPAAPAPSAHASGRLIPQEVGYVRVAAYYVAPDPTNPNHSRDGQSAGTAPTALSNSSNNLPAGVIPRPTGANPQVTNLTFTNLPLGVKVRFVAQSFLAQPPAPPANFSMIREKTDVDAQGNLALTYGEEDIEKIQSGVSFSVNIDSAVDHLTTDPATLPSAMPPGLKYTITVTARDKQENVVPVKQGVMVQDINNATASANGFDVTASAAAAGPAKITIKEPESMKTITLDFTAQGPAPPGLGATGTATGDINGQGSAAGQNQQNEEDVTLIDVAADQAARSAFAAVLVNDRTVTSSSTDDQVEFPFGGSTSTLLQQNVTNNPKYISAFDLHYQAASLAWNTKDIVVADQYGSLYGYDTRGYNLWILRGSNTGYPNSTTITGVSDMTASGSKTYVLASTNSGPQVYVLDDSNDASNTPPSYTSFPVTGISSPSKLASDGTNVYVANSATVYKIDASRNLQQTFQLQNAPNHINDIACDGSYLYVSTGADILLYGLDGTYVTSYAAQGKYAAAEVIDASSSHLDTAIQQNSNGSQNVLVTQF